MPEWCAFLMHTLVYVVKIGVEIINTTQKRI